jgi:2'-5' RNA ligase
MRLFIALHFSEEVRRVLLDAIAALRAQSDAGGFTRPENQHLTLAFIGESNDTAAIRRVIDRCAVPPFGLTIGGFGRFGDLCWAGVEENPALKGLADTLQHELRKAGFPIETRPFKPHITLGRRIVSASPPRVNVPRTAMTVGRGALMKSERINGRLVYTELYSRPL